jgi:hypothetical protein
MKCIEVQDLLSPYCDGELNSLRAGIAEHLQTCARCTAALARIRSLATLARELPDPIPPKMWPGIEQALDRAADPVLSGPSRPERFGAVVSWIKNSTWHWPAGLVAVAASLLIGFFARPLVHPGTSHEMSANLSQFITQFASDPDAAEHELRSRYPSRPIDPADAIRLVNYQPMAPAQLSDGVLRNQTYLVEMPCCKCVQTLYRRADGGAVAVFEHVDDDLDSFGNRPTIHANCSGKDVCLVQCNSQLAVTWKEKERYITLVGAKDLQDASRLIAGFGDHTS